jgi:hypothetical protein
MKTNVSETLYRLVCKEHKNYDYFLTEFIGYVSPSQCREIPADIAVFSGDEVEVELPDALCEEIMENFSSDMSLGNALDILMISGILMGGL